MSDIPLMMPGFGNDFETEALPGALPGAPQLATPGAASLGLAREAQAGAPLWSSRRGAKG